MPKRKQPGKSASRVSKAQAIREYKKSNPNAMPKAIAEEMKKHGLNCTPQYVSMILSNDRRKGGKPTRKPGRPAGSTNAASTRAKATGGAKLSVEDLLLAKKFISELGGVEKAKSAVDALEKLSSGL